MGHILLKETSYEEFEMVSDGVLMLEKVAKRDHVDSSLFGFQMSQQPRPMQCNQ